MESRDRDSSSDSADSESPSTGCSDVPRSSNPIVTLVPRLLSDLSQIPPPESCETAHAFLLSEYFERAGRALAASDLTGSRSQIYLSVIPCLATQHAGVSDAIYAVAAISLAIAKLKDVLASTERSRLDHETTADAFFRKTSEPYLQQAHKHYGRCLIALQKNVSCLKCDNTDAIVACSALLIVFEHSLSRVTRYRRRLMCSNSGHMPTAAHKRLGNSTQDASESRPLDLNWMKHIRGLGSLMPSVDARWPARKSDMHPFFKWPNRTDCGTFELLRRSRLPLKIPNGPDTAVLSHPLLPTLLAEGQIELAKLQRRIRALRWQPGQPHDPIKLSLGEEKIHLSAVNRLHVSIQYFMSSSITESPQTLYRVFAYWVAQMDDPYLHFLSQHDTVALAIYCFYLVYMILFQDFWWIGDLGIATLQDILSAVHGRVEDRSSTNPGGSLLLDLFQWPDRIVNLCKNLI